MKRQGLLTTIEELRKIADELERQVKDDEKAFRVSGFATNFQLNIINKTNESDGWRFE